MINKISKFLLSVLMICSMFIVPLSVQAEEVNLALGAQVNVSGVEGGNNEDGTLVYPQFNPSMVSDGNYGTRWSSSHTLLATEVEEVGEQNAWVEIDLKNPINFNKVNIHWEAANSRWYELQASNDGDTWDTLKEYKDLNKPSQSYIETYYSDDIQEYRFIRVYAKLGNLDNYKTISIYEVEIFNENNDGIEAAIQEVKGIAPLWNENHTKINLPQPSNEMYHTRLYATSNEAIVSLDNQVTTPLNDMNVNLFYEVYSDEGESYRIDEPYDLFVGGEVNLVPNANLKPNVLPSLREWQGRTGEFKFSGNIVIDNEKYKECAEMIQYYFEEMLHKKYQIVIGRPSVGDIYFSEDASLNIGKEGYTLDIQDFITASFSHEKGMLYAGTTLTQIMSQSEELNSVPKGSARDYPQYQVRSILLDVARFYMPIDYLTEMTKYAAYFKLNEIHLHINDNGGETPYSFRVESKKYPEINKGVVTYTQDEYKNYQKEVSKYGIEVITEIDSPGHSGAIMNIRPDLMLEDGYHMNLNNPETIPFMQSLYDEFLDGEDPVFQGSKFHIGMDEYDRSYSEQVRAYMDAMIHYINGKGLETRMWASLGKGGFVGNTPVSKDATVYFWADHDADFNEMKAEGYRFINTDGGRIYIVPSHFNDYLNVPYLYETWEVSQYRGGYYLPAGHPQNMGAEGALWNDIKVGMSEFDVFDRSKDQMILMSEKTWAGERDKNISGDMFVANYQKLPKKTPGANPYRYIESSDDMVISYTFDECDNSYVKDVSGNEFNALTNNVSVKNEEGETYALFDGNGSLKLPVNALGYPYTVSMRIYIDEKNPANSKLLDSKEGTLYYNYENTGKLGYERKGYSYLFDKDIPVNEWCTLTMQSTNTDAILYINGKEVARGMYYKVDAVKQASSSFVLPLSEIGKGLHGKLAEFTVYNEIKDPLELYQPGSNINSDNLLLNKSVEVSSIEGGYTDEGSLVYPQFDPKHLTDGNQTTRNSFAPNDHAWFIVDMDKEKSIHTIMLNFNEKPIAYELYVSLDKQNWIKIDERTKLVPQEKGTEIHALDKIISARYIKYVQMEGFPYPGFNHLCGNLNEIEAYGIKDERVTEIIDDAKFVLNKNNSEAVSVQKAMEQLKESLDLFNKVKDTGISYDEYSDMVIILLQNTKTAEKELLKDMITNWTNIDDSELDEANKKKRDANIKLAEELMATVGIDQDKWELGFNEIELLPKVDRTLLVEIIDKAEGITEKELSEMEPSSANEFRISLAKAKEVCVNEKATQKDIDDAYNLLKSAMDGLKKMEDQSNSKPILPEEDHQMGTETGDATNVLALVVLLMLSGIITIYVLQKKKSIK